MKFGPSLGEHGVRVVFYLRVSTPDQAESQLSIPDQERKLEALAKQKGWTVVGRYIDAGLTGTNDRRPEFQRMMADAARKPRPFDVVAVYVLSRLARNTFDGLACLRDLRKDGIRLESATQHFPDGSDGDLMMTMIMAFDQHLSAEISKHVTRTRLENARNGYWNGAKPPLGYETETVGVMGRREKKKLKVSETEAPIVREIFDLCLSGRGCKSIVKVLNGSGILMRGSRFNINRINQILRDSAYTGVYLCNGRTRGKGDARPGTETIPLECPIIIGPDDFHRVQELLDGRNPKKNAAAAVGSRILLSGLIKCPGGKAMSLRTGKGGRYRYYTCNEHARTGCCGCGGLSMRMDVVDDLVLAHFVTRILAPERLREIVWPLINNDESASQRRKETIISLTRQIASRKKTIDNFLDSIGRSGHSDLIERKLSEARASLVELTIQMDKLAAEERNRATMTDEESIERLSIMLIDVIRSKDPEIIRPYLKSFIHKIVINHDQIQICGSGANLVRALGSSGSGGGVETKQKRQKAGEYRESGATAVVPTFIPEWRKRWDSNPRGA